MLACLVDTDAPCAGQRVLGLTLLQRAALHAQAAGATRLWSEPVGVAALRALHADGRLRVELLATEAEPAGDALVLRADALCGVAALRALEPEQLVTDAHGTVLAARLLLQAGQAAQAGQAGQAAPSPRARLAAASCAGRARDRDGLHVRDGASLAEARRRLLDALVKPTDGPVSRHLNRHLSRALTRLVLPLGVTPNQMTALVALVGAAAAYCAAQPGHATQVLGGVLYQLHSVIDGCDGELARLTHRFGKHGALLDSLVDDASNAAFFFGLSLGVARALSLPWPLFTGALTVACYLGVAFVQYRVVLRATGKGEKTAFWTEAEARRGPVMRALHALGRRDVFVLVIMLALALGLAPVVVAALPVMAVGALATSLARARGTPLGPGV